MKVVKVRTSVGLREAVARANNRPGLDRIIMIDNVNLNPSSAGPAARSRATSTSSTT